MGEVSEKQLATELWQKYLMAGVIIIIGTLGTGNIMLIKIYGKLGGIEQRVVAVEKRVDRLETYQDTQSKNNQPMTQPPIGLPVIGPMSDRRKLRMNHDTE